MTADGAGVRMPFGRFRNRPVSALPDSYLRWLLTLDTLRPPLHEAVRAEAEFRGLREGRDDRRVRDAAPLARPELALALIGAGHRTLAVKFHPDHGGSHDEMVAVNEAAAWLRRQLQALA